MQIRIEPATINHLKDIQNLNLQLCEKEHKEFDPTINPKFPIQKEGEDYFKERIKNDCALVALFNGKVVGYLVGAISEAEEYRNVSRIAEAENMLVLEEFRSKGIGKQLFQEFIKWCKSKKIKRVKVVASALNKHAIEFYRREGFDDYDLVLEKEI
ncbi:MAG: GNAT family N-acetyltransferase [archaeon]